MFYPEFRTANNASGAVRRLDWESGVSVLGTLVTGDVTSRVGFRTRSKGVPTGSYDMMVGDRRAETLDESLWGEVSGAHEFSPTVHSSLRAYADRGMYQGQFPYDSGPAFRDRALSADIGTEVMLTWDATSRNRFTLGAELRRVFNAEYKTRDQMGRLVGDNAPFGLGSIYAQDELQLSNRLKLVGGMRFDRKNSRSQAVAPRFAIVATPSDRSTVKLLYGQAFRSPSVAEADLHTDYYKPDTTLRAERIATWELTGEHRLASSVLVGASAYHYAIHDLIEQVTADTTSGFRYTNAALTRGRGIELTLNLQPVSAPLTFRGWYALQQTRDDSTRQYLTNSPQQTINASVASRSAYNMHAAATIRHESSRKTLDGSSTNQFTRVDVNVGYLTPSSARWHWLHGSDFSLRVSNLFNTSYSVPGGLEHVQQSIQQNGRTLSFRMRRDF